MTDVLRMIHMKTIAMDPNDQSPDFSGSGSSYFSAVHVNSEDKDDSTSPVLSRAGIVGLARRRNG